MRITFLAFAFCGFLAGSAANAAPVTADPDVFANGTNISNAFVGVTLSGPGQANPSVFSQTSGLASTGTRVFGNTASGVEWGDGFNAGMRADFASPTDFVSIDIIGNDSFDTGRLLAFDSSNNLLDTFTTGALGNGTVVTASITRPTSDIAYVLATGSANGAESVSLDNLRFNQNVPEPMSVAVFGGLATAGIVGYRRRRAKA